MGILFLLKVKGLNPKTHQSWEKSVRRYNRLEFVLEVKLNIKLAPKLNVSDGYSKSRPGSIKNLLQNLKLDVHRYSLCKLAELYHNKNRHKIHFQDVQSWWRHT